MKNALRVIRRVRRFLRELRGVLLLSTQILVLAYALG